MAPRQAFFRVLQQAFRELQTMPARILRLLPPLAALFASAAVAAPGDLPLGSPPLVFERTDLAYAGVGGVSALAAQGGGEGELLLEGVAGEVSLALLYWHGVDLEWDAQGFTGGNGDYDEAAIQFAGQAITGTRLGSGGYDNNWGDGGYLEPQRFSAALYRADVTQLVSGSGSYTIAGLADGTAHSANGASLVVFHDDGNPVNDLRVEHHEVFDSNLDTLVGPNWQALVPVSYQGGRVELILHVADGQSGQTDGEYNVHVFPGLLPADDTEFDFGSPHTDGEPLWGGRSVPRMGHGRIGGGDDLWDIRRFDLTPAFHKPGEHAVYGFYQGGSDYLTLMVLQLVQSAPGQAPALVPHEHGFGDLPLDTASAVQRFTFTNLQNDAITLGTVLRGNVVFSIVGNTCNGSVLAPGASCSVDLQCTPGAARDYTSVLQVPWEDRFGEDRQARAYMRCSGLAGASHGRIAVDPPEAWFGTQPPGSTAAVRHFTVTSIGSAPVSMGSIERYGPYLSAFRLEANSCTGTVLPPGERCGFDLRFRPPADRGLGTLFADVSVEFATDGIFHLPANVLVAGTTVPDHGAIFKDGFEAP